MRRKVRIHDAELNPLAYETHTVLDCSHDRPSSAETSLADKRLTNQKDHYSLWNYPSLCSGHFGTPFSLATRHLLPAPQNTLRIKELE